MPNPKQGYYVVKCENVKNSHNEGVTFYGIGHKRYTSSGLFITFGTFKESCFDEWTSENLH